MVVKTSRMCDRCGKEGAQQLQFHVGYVYGAPSADPDYDSVDVCGGCALDFLRAIAALQPNVTGEFQLLALRNFEQTAVLLKWLRRKRG